jgi:hypothetical protein
MAQEYFTSYQVLWTENFLAQALPSSANVYLLISHNHPKQTKDRQREQHRQLIEASKLLPLSFTFTFPFSFPS